MDPSKDAQEIFLTDKPVHYLDNIFIERLWRSLKYEAACLRELADGRDAERIVGSWVNFHNELRPHSALDGHTPDEACRGAVPEVA